MYRIGEFAEIAGVTPRLLRHYESVGVLTPAVTDARNGYRYYTRQQVAMLQRVLAYREAGLPLSVIADLLREEAPHGLLLERQREALVAERTALDRKLALLDAEIQRLATRPFRMTWTTPIWIASVRRSVQTYAAAEALVSDLRSAWSADVTTPSAAVWHLCRPGDGQIDCEAQLVFRHPGVGLQAVPSHLVASFAHTGPEAELPLIYDEMRRWSRAAGYRYSGPLREVYFGGVDGPPVIEVQFPVTAVS